MTPAIRLLIVSLSSFTLPTLAAERSLTVVHDGGGVSAEPYYRALNLKAREPARTATAPAIEVPLPPNRRYAEADFLPVRSMRLRPGTVTPRKINVSGLTPIFLIGDDSRSRAWLRTNALRLKILRAIGFVVQVESAAALHSLRQLVPDLTLVPASGDDIAQRLAIEHYPVLITAAAIEP